MNNIVIKEYIGRLTGIKQNYTQFYSCVHDYNLVETYKTEKFYNEWLDEDYPLEEFGLYETLNDIISPRQPMYLINPNEPFYLRRDTYYCPKCGDSYHRITIALTECPPYGWIKKPNFMK